MRTICATLLTAVLLLNIVPTFAQQQESVAVDVIAQINAWRLDNNLWPVQRNATLDALAMQQAAYLLTLSDLPADGAIHLGPDGKGPQDRAAKAPYNWPTYGRADRMMLNEIAYVGYDVKAALTFWQGSDIHRRTAMNPAYREIGVAVLPHPYGHLIIVDLAARPNVLPVQVDPSAGLLYLSNDRNTGACTGNWICDATEVRFLDASGQPVGEGSWQPWHATLPIPTDLGSSFEVEFSDGNSQITTPVDLTANQVLLPGSAVAAAPTPTATRPPSTATPTTATAAPAASEAAPTQASTPDLRLYYDARTLGIVNVSGQALDLSGLVISQGSHMLPITSWKTQYLSAPLDAFPAQDCLQVWGWNEPNALNLPPGCRYVRSVITISPDKLFWGTNDFEVQEGGFTLARCKASAGQCDVRLGP